MRGKPWHDQLAVGRVFELRSSSKRYPPPCALVVSEKPKYGEREVVQVDRFGVIGQGLYCRSSNPRIYVDGLRGDELTTRVTRRRRDLERFDRDDLDLIRQGYAVDFDGRIRAFYSEMSRLPLVPATWTIFWLPAHGKCDCWYPPLYFARDYLAGAWYFTQIGGARHLGYKYGRLWATRHQGKRLDAFRKALRAMRPDVIEQECRVVRWQDGDDVVTAEVRRECPALGSRSIHRQCGSNSAASYWTWRND